MIVSSYSFSIHIPSCRLAQSVKLMIAIAIFFTFTLQFYVPVSILWKGIESKIPAARQNMSEYGMRVGLVVSLISLLNALPIKLTVEFLYLTVPVLRHCRGAAQSRPVHLAHRRRLPEHAGHDRAGGHRIGCVLRGARLRALQVAAVEELRPDTVRHCWLCDRHVREHTRVPGRV